MSAAHGRRGGERGAPLLIAVAMAAVLSASRRTRTRTRRTRNRSASTRHGAVPIHGPSASAAGARRTSGCPATGASPQYSTAKPAT